MKKSQKQSRNDSKRNGKRNCSRSPILISKMKIAIIGAGVAGITAIRQLSMKIPNAEITAFEMCDSIGGIWKYTEQTKKDDYGVPPWGKVYKSLRANLPKLVMEFSDLKCPDDFTHFLKHEEMLTYLDTYMKKYDLYKYIKFRHRVYLVSKFGGNLWEITYKNLIHGARHKEIFDYVILCTGTFTVEAYPHYEQNLFKGSQIHSIHYKKPDFYKDKIVLVIGGGSSGIDISIEVAKVAKKIFFSHHNDYIDNPFPENHVQKPDVRKINKDSVEFVDESVEKIDAIIYCTGYGYSFPFLNNNCGITALRYHVTPLYKHIVNINNPTMFFIGIPQSACSVVLRETQARYIAAYLNNEFALPTKERMIKHMENDYNSKDKLHYPIERIATHILGKDEIFYYRQLTNEASISPVSPVVCAIRNYISMRPINHYEFRNYIYIIIDDEHFAIIRQGESIKMNARIFNSDTCLGKIKEEKNNNNDSTK